MGKKPVKQVPFYVAASARQWCFVAGVWEAETKQSQRAHEISFYWGLPMCMCAKDFMCLTLYTPFMNPTRQLYFYVFAKNTETQRS